MGLTDPPKIATVLLKIKCKKRCFINNSLNIRAGNGDMLSCDFDTVIRSRINNHYSLSSLFVLIEVFLYPRDQVTACLLKLKHPQQYHFNYLSKSVKFFSFRQAYLQGLEHVYCISCLRVRHSLQK